LSLLIQGHPVNPHPPSHTTHPPSRFELWSCVPPLLPSREQSLSKPKVILSIAPQRAVLRTSLLPVRDLCRLPKCIACGGLPPANNDEARPQNSSICNSLSPFHIGRFQTPFPCPPKTYTNALSLLRIESLWYPGFAPY